MKHMKRFLAILLAVVMVLCAVPVATAYVYSGSCGNNVTYTLDSDTGILQLVGYGKTKDYDTSSRKWGSADSVIKTITIPNGITYLGDNLFRNCYNATNIPIPSSVKSFGTGVFYNCQKLNSIIIPNGITVIPQNLFYGCMSLSSIDIPNTVESIELGAFSGCSGATTITVPNSVSYIGQSAFSGCSSVIEVSIPNSVTTLGSSAFCNCSDLQTVEIGTGITTIPYGAFYNCIDLRNVTLPNSLTTIENSAFRGCTSLQTITVPEGVTSINSYAFENCSNLKSVYLPRTLERLASPGVFGNCNLLKDIYFAGSETEWNSILYHVLIPSTATVHYNYNIYNLGEETYSFQNFSNCIKGQSCYGAGHCFGMSVTSSAYYNGWMDISQIYDVSRETVFELPLTTGVRIPLCYYQMRQGHCLQNAIVAGSLNIDADINDEWTDMTNYVRGHDYDNCGTLIIGYRGQYHNNGNIVSDGHAVNFLYYSVEDGQERIYAYDSNYPEDITYFYQDDNGRICQTPATFDVSIDCISFVEVETYLQEVTDFNMARVIYSKQNTIDIEGLNAYHMLGSIEPCEQVMYEIPDNLTQVKITPLVDNASFTYMDHTYTFGAIDGDTYGVLTLSATESGSGTLVIENAPTHEPDQPDTPVTPEPDPQPANLCPWCGQEHVGFFAGLIAWFHSILARIFGARF